MAQLIGEVWRSTKTAILKLIRYFVSMVSEVDGGVIVIKQAKMVLLAILTCFPKPFPTFHPLL